MDLCVHFGKPAFIVFTSLYLYFGFSNKHFSISIQLFFFTHGVQETSSSQTSKSSGRGLGNGSCPRVHVCRGHASTTVTLSVSGRRAKATADQAATRVNRHQTSCRRRYSYAQA